MGMAKGFILDKLYEDWKSELNFSKTLNQLLYERLWDYGLKMNNKELGKNKL